ncbi:DUF2274 domain-containing protein [Asticcacaulis sp. BYS171W]|uniref:DUF2274 domain-containing protein n=1 Tax=Asticcacaulis aquaticus TaxID=2984212 RepID=A0ABT5HRQ0_9CAUL|nr:DUF2274 domain-containing protein [Asticcacaulis aquaticus]
MAELKLPRLPDRTPVKLTVTLGAELNQALKDYADLYQTTYGSPESVVELIPFMLEAFLASDKNFRPAKK